MTERLQLVAPPTCRAETATSLAKPPTPAATALARDGCGAGFPIAVRSAAGIIKLAGGSANSAANEASPPAVAAANTACIQGTGPTEQQPVCVIGQRFGRGERSSRDRVGDRATGRPGDRAVDCTDRPERWPSAIGRRAQSGRRRLRRGEWFNRSDIPTGRAFDPGQYCAQRLLPPREPFVVVPHPVHLPFRQGQHRAK